VKGEDYLNWLLFQNLVLVLILTSVAVAIQAWLFRRVGHEKMRGNHEVAGFVYAVVGAIFAVNVALALDTVHDEFVNGSRASMQEAIQLEGIYRVASLLEADQRDNIRTAIVAYTKSVTEKEWGDWSKSSEGVQETNKAYGMIWQSISKIDPKTNGQQLAYAEILSRTNTIDISRQARLHAGVQRPPAGIQALQWLGGFITVGFGLFFTMENRRAHMLMLISISLLVWGNLVVLYTVRFPYNGFSFLEPTPYLQFLGRVIQ
jgi:hypothetical protein